MSDKSKVENRRYIGSKFKLKDWIISNIKKECEGNIFADIFAGTGIVAAEASKFYDTIILNDILFSNLVSYEAFFVKGQYDTKKLFKISESYNILKPDKISTNYFSENFGGKYFSFNNSKIIGFIRDDIENKKAKLTQKEYHILLTSLLYSTDKNANTVGHYEAYFKNSMPAKEFTFKLIEPMDPKKVKIFREDANILSKKIKADIVYIDPPYNSRQYSRFYHLLETLVKWDNSELFGVALKPELENMSDYSTNRAPEAFSELISNLNCKYIAVSYNNTYNSKSSSSKNKMSLEHIELILKNKGKTKVFKKSHPHFNSGKTDFKDHQEWLFITKVNG